MARKLSPNDDREAFFAAIKNNELNLIDTIKWMRRITGLTQHEYAKLIGIAPRIIIDLERGLANPTLGTLIKIGKPFGLTLGFVMKNKG